ncbi:type II CAAX endopeptidase family protein [uncultured Polaribacter sp.]|uniref:CPBP family intramembrane glutamic endopeptidase n=1 Tax=uncultured Polaribacter sp. TaxID=174711 RepID=UPI002620CC55|nr:type II CAAX endopeptidase family protein [uncultured Polaribacter sp.]
MIIFILIPLSYLFEYSLVIKLVIGILGFGYILFVLVRVEKNRFKIGKHLKWRLFWKRILINLLIIAIVTSAFVWFTNKESLFAIVLNKPKIWILILFFYSFFSVYPQELIYRTFFFQRYKKLFKNDILFILINALLFSLAHIFFKNALVLLLTFIGGILFALTYRKTKSTLLVAIEHSIYGCWLFTVGMGSMLGFPS